VSLFLGLDAGGVSFNKHLIIMTWDVQHLIYDEILEFIPTQVEVPTNADQK
jgi:hypothetical protein